MYLRIENYFERSFRVLGTTTVIMNRPLTPDFKGFFHFNQDAPLVPICNRYLFVANKKRSVYKLFFYYNFCRGGCVLGGVCVCMSTVWFQNLSFRQSAAIYPQSTNLFCFVGGQPFKPPLKAVTRAGFVSSLAGFDFSLAYTTCHCAYKYYWQTI